MADLSGLGDLVLTVGGDITPLTSALDEIPAAAQQAASQIQAAFDALPSATEEVNASLANLSAGLTEAGSSASETAGHVAEVPPALHDTSEAAGEAGDKLKEFVTAGLELAGIALTFEALKEAVTEIVSAFDQLQRADFPHGFNRIGRASHNCD
jgi:methyl-accepting chemotaxis protein